MNKLERPIVVCDTETTGTDQAKDGILTLCMMKVEDSLDNRDREFYAGAFNGHGILMDDEVISIHHITNEMASLESEFSKECGEEILGFLKGCDICGFNVKFDMGILWQELYRVGLTWDTSTVNVFDAYQIFSIKHPRDLSAAVEFYCGHKHDGAHDARADVLATWEVFSAQMDAYPDLENCSAEDLSRFCATRKDGSRALDFAGTVVLDKNGVARYTHKKVRGVAVKDDPGYAGWMLRTDFPAQTKMVLHRLLGNLNLDDHELGGDE